jgi:CheY-like chemotaxis protein
MGGEIGVTSRRDEGTSFWFTVQLHDIAAEQLTGYNSVSHPQVQEHYLQTLAGKRVLVVEDNRINQMVVQGMLAKAGVSVDVVDDGVDACDRMIKEGATYDCILMDWEMPEMDGVTAARRILEWERRHNKPASIIVALTAHVLPEYEAQAAEVGMRGFLKKPLEREVLCKTLVMLLQQSGARPADEAQEAVVEPAPRRAP